MQIMLFFYCWRKKIEITHTTHYVPVVNLKTQYNAHFLQAVKSSSKGAINWSKYQSKPTI